MCNVDFDNFQSVIGLKADGSSQERAEGKLRENSDREMDAMGIVSIVFLLQKTQDNRRS